MPRVSTRLALALCLLAAAPAGGLAAAGPAAAAGVNVRIVNSATSGVLMPQDYGNNSSDGILMYAWHDYDTQGGEQWNVEHTSSGYHLIRNVKTGKCLKPGGTFHNKPSVSQGSCNDAYEFHWTFEKNTSGEHKITSRSTNKVLAPYYGREPGEVVVLEPDSRVAKNWWSVDGI
ncbi:RICIN domain-containing protein [Streptomyces sp. NPDC058612]|uniref:RICIN domain-containing protein n=1 Tax=Streptomyces sp. NPDC058612 TaxID=3346555 RepID=UPI00365D49CB